ncbi:hypothetical protein H4219_000210 [Mycoemilia scoparia]|uniref:EamA domain-containing protein n=1 Tax=Mycoemilia scoparia TaxID=417184 RepID=A0A9W8A410_9FUNG|nr:hypothetical protein H4219_000210 [Mycoemilia scoparia]
MLEVNYDKQHKQFHSETNPEPFAYVPLPSDVFAVVGGTFAAAASLYAKLMVDSNIEMAAKFVQDLFGSDLDPQKVELGARGIMLFLVVVCNALMWLFFTKALRYSTSSVRVTTIQTIVNFIVTGLLGSYVFNDALSVQWWFGVSLIAAGLTVISSPKNAVPIPDNVDAEKKTK